jgi:hypothetical protein
MTKQRQNLKRKPKLSDAQRHERFVDMAREVEASEDASSFDKAFEKVTAPPKAAKQDGS